MRLRDIATLVDTNASMYDVKYKDDIIAHALPEKNWWKRTDKNVPSK